MRNYLAILIVILYSGFVFAQEYQHIEIQKDSKIYSAHMNKDKRLDLIIEDQGNIAIYYARENGDYGQIEERSREEALSKNWSFQPCKPDLLLAKNWLDEIEIKDFNADGINDVAVISPARRKIAFYWGDGQKGNKEKPDTFLQFNKKHIFLIDFEDANGDELLDLYLLGPEGVHLYLQKDKAFDEKVELTNALSVARWSKESHAWGTLGIFRYNFVFDVNNDSKPDFCVPNIGLYSIFIQGAENKYSKFADLKYSTRIAPARVNQSGDQDSPPYVVGSSFKRENDDDKAVAYIEVDLPAIEQIAYENKPGISLVFGMRLAKAWSYDKSKNELIEIENYNKPWGRRIVSEINQESNETEYRMILDLNEADKPSREHDFVLVQIPFTTSGLGNNIRIFYDKKSIPREPQSRVPDYKKSDASFRESNFLLDPVFGDVNGDNRLDMVFLKTDYQITNIGKWMKANKGNVEGDLIFHFYDPSLKGGVDSNGRKQPKGFKHKNYGDFALKNLKMSFDLDAGLFGDAIFRVAASMISLEGDFNGDGRQDLVIRTGNNRMSIYYNTGKAGAYFSKSPDKKMKIPNYEDMEIKDCNQDGKSDFIFRKWDSHFLTISKP